MKKHADNNGKLHAKARKLPPPGFCMTRGLPLFLFLEHDAEGLARHGYLCGAEPSCRKRRCGDAGQNADVSGDMARIAAAGSDDRIIRLVAVRGTHTAETARTPRRRTEAEGRIFRSIRRAVHDRRGTECLLLCAHAKRRRNMSREPFALSRRGCVNEGSGPPGRAHRAEPVFRHAPEFPGMPRSRPVQKDRGSSAEPALLRGFGDARREYPPPSPPWARQFPQATPGQYPAPR